MTEHPESTLQQLNTELVYPLAVRLSAPLMSWANSPRASTSTRIVLSLSTGAGKSATLLMALEAAGLSRRLTVSHREATWARANQGIPWTVIDAADAQPTTAGLGLASQPYAPRRLRVGNSPTTEYKVLCRKATEWEASGRGQDRQEVGGDRRARNPAARSAVLLRSGGRCENPDCLLPELPYRTKAGKPLLEVDHIDGHASGGRDHPAAMTALCPNCHSNKTRGADQTALTERSRKAATEHHDAWASRVA